MIVLSMNIRDMNLTKFIYRGQHPIKNWDNRSRRGGSEHLEGVWIVFLSLPLCVLLKKCGFHNIVHGLTKVIQTQILI